MLQLPQMTTTPICFAFGDNFADTFFNQFETSLSRLHTCTVVVGVFLAIALQESKI